MISPSADLMAALLGEDGPASGGGGTALAERPSRRGRVEDQHLPAPYPETDDEDDVVYWNYTSAWWEEQDAAMEHLHIVWVQNILFLLGLQWHERNEMRGTWERRRGPKWKEYPVTNLCLPYFKHVLAKLTKNKPAWLTKPASTDPEDIESAELGQQALESKWTELRMARVIRRMAAWLITTGNAYVLPYWNTLTGRMRPLTTPVEAVQYDAETGQPVGVTIIDCPCDLEGSPFMTEDGRYDVEREPIYYDEGDVGARLLSPFQVRVDAGAAADDDVSEVVVVEPITVRDLQRRYGIERTEGVSGEDTGALDDFDRLLSGLFAAGADTHMVSGSAAQRDELIPRVRLFHHYTKQSEEYPEGRYWCVAGGKLMADPQQLPDQLWPPVVHLVDVEVPGRYHGMATMEAVVGLNREYNEVTAQIKEHHNLLLRGKWLVPIGSNIRRGQLTAEPGEVVQHTPGLAPKMAELRPLPAEVYKERERIVADFQLVSGLNKISMGQAPPGVTAGRAFLVLQEADDTDMGPLIQMLEEAVAEIAWMFLQLMQANYTEERLIQIVGENRRFMVRSFTGSDLRGVVDVIPQTGSAFPWNQMARQSMLLELMKLQPQLFTDDETGMLDRARIARLIPSAGIDALAADTDEDMNEAKREEEEIAEGLVQVIEPQPWQNPYVHLRSHASVLKSAGFRQWPVERQAAMVLHYQMTRAGIEALRQQAVREMVDQQRRGGNRNGSAPPEDGGPGVAPEETAVDAAARELTEGGSIHIPVAQE